MVWNWTPVFRDMPLLLAGLKTTLILASASVVGGMVVGMIVAVAQLSRKPIPNAIAIIYKEVFRCSPLLVVLIWLYYCMPILLHVRLSSMGVGLVTLIGYGGAVFGETFRAGLQAIPREQREAASSLHLSSFQTYRYVLIPQLTRIVIPPVISWSLSILKESSLVSVLSIGDLMFTSRTLAVKTYLPFEFLTAAAVLYYLVGAPLEQLANYLDDRLSRAGRKASGR